MRAAFYTLGCKLNQCESESVASSFSDAGWTIVPPLADADLYIVNTCTVTSKSEQKARRIIRKLSREHPLSVIIVSGCYAQLETEEISGLSESVLVIPHTAKSLLHDIPAGLDSAGISAPGPLFVSWLRQFTAEAAERGKDAGTAADAVNSDGTAGGTVIDPFRYEVREQVFHTRSFLKIQDGCDNRCAYCRVPLARGNSVSLEIEPVLDRVRALADRGSGEIVLTGVNISAYRDGSMGLADLIARILRLPGTFRVRLSSLEPDRIGPDLLEIFSDGRICPHFHLPIQSGSDSVLSGMKRRYLSDTVRSVIDELRRVKQDPFIAADIIAGFPGEGAEEFAETVAFLTEIDCAFLHVFPFSPRPGTPAFTMRPAVPERITEERVLRLQRLSDSGHAAYIRRWIGREENALIESKTADSRGFWTGTTGNYLRIMVSAPVGSAEISPGAILPVAIVGGEPLAGTRIRHT